MARYHCRYCGNNEDHNADAGFASLEAYDAHLIRYRQFELPESVGFPSDHGLPVCRGQKQGSPFKDPFVARARLRGQLAGQRLRALQEDPDAALSANRP